MCYKRFEIARSPPQNILLGIESCLYLIRTLRCRVYSFLQFVRNYPDNHWGTYLYQGCGLIYEISDSAISLVFSQKKYCTCDAFYFSLFVICYSNQVHDKKRLSAIESSCSGYRQYHHLFKMHWKMQCKQCKYEFTNQTKFSLQKVSNVSRGCCIDARIIIREAI